MVKIVQNYSKNIKTVRFYNIFNAKLINIHHFTHKTGIYTHKTDIYTFLYIHQMLLIS